MIVRNHQLHPFESAPLQGAEEILVGSLALGVRHLHGNDLAHPVLPHRTDDEDALAHHPPVRPGLLVASVHEQVGVGLRFEPAVPPPLELSVQTAGQRGD